MFFKLIIQSVYFLKTSFQNFRNILCKVAVCFLSLYCAKVKSVIRSECKKYCIWIIEYTVPIQERKDIKNKCSSQMRRKCSVLFQFHVAHKHIGYACYFSQNQAAEHGHFLTMIDRGMSSSVFSNS